MLQAGGGWKSDGGHFNGRKWPIMFAGAMLGEAGMTSPGVDIGNEDRMTYEGANGKALWGRDCNDCYFPNGCEYSGSCTNGSKDCRDPDHLVDGCGDYRNCCTSHTWFGCPGGRQHHVRVRVRDVDDRDDLPSPVSELWGDGRR